MIIINIIMATMKKIGHMILWFTGQPGSGKTTLTRKFIKEVLIDKCSFMKEIVHIDGDDLRDLDNRTIQKKERHNNIRLAMNLQNSHIIKAI